MVSGDLLSIVRPNVLTVFGSGHETLGHALVAQGKLYVAKSLLPTIAKNKLILSNGQYLQGETTFQSSIWRNVAVGENDNLGNGLNIAQQLNHGGCFVGATSLDQAIVLAYRKRLDSSEV